jgi:dTDP-D-glucose 4,6-dehydratase
VLREGDPGEICVLGADDVLTLLDDGLAETVEWFRSRRDWWEPIKTRTDTPSSEEQYAHRSGG